MRALGWLLPILGLGLPIGYVLIWYLAWPWVFTPPIQCDVADTELCELTLHADWPWRNPRPDSIHVHDVPNQWRSWDIPEFANAEWAASVEDAFDPVFEAACYREDDGTATCYLLAE